MDVRLKICPLYSCPKGKGSARPWSRWRHQEAKWCSLGHTGLTRELVHRSLFCSLKCKLQWSKIDDWGYIKVIKDLWIEMAHCLGCWVCKRLKDWWWRSAFNLGHLLHPAVEAVKNPTQISPKWNEITSKNTSLLLRSTLLSCDKGKVGQVESWTNFLIADPTRNPWRCQKVKLQSSYPSAWNECSPSNSYFVYGHARTRSSYVPNLFGLFLTILATLASYVSSIPLLRMFLYFMILSTLSDSSVFADMRCDQAHSKQSRCVGGPGVGDVRLDSPCGEQYFKGRHSKPWSRSDSNCLFFVYFRYKAVTDPGHLVMLQCCSSLRVVFSVVRSQL